MSADGLWDAIDADDAAAVRAILALEPALARARDAAGVPALLHALYRRSDADLIDVLREHAEPLDVFEAAAVGATARLAELLNGDGVAERISADGFTPLHLAAFFAQPDAVEALLAAGADPRAVANNPMRVEPVHSAAAGRSYRAVALLLEYGASVDARQAGGFVPLHAAAANGDEDIVDLLLDGGADHTARTDDGQSVPGLARENGHDELARRLGG